MHYQNMKTAKELKAIGWNALRGNYKKAIGAMFLSGLIYVVPLCFPAMKIGYTKFNTKLVRKENTRATEVLEGFSLFGRALWLTIITNFFVFLWSLLFIIPGIMKSFSYSMAPYILADNPQMTSSEALNLSKKLMEGNRGRLFYLELSFIGWFVLVLITSGIALIWINPYLQATLAAFYNEEIKPGI